MTAPTSTFEELREDALAALASASDDAALEQWRVAWLGRQGGRVTGL
jgi:hypothetical protein